MSARDNVSPALEYQSLREELNQSKKYVFERPLLIAGVSIGLMTSEWGGHAGIFPLFMVGLLLFNFWFTINRLTSGARIVAYIHLVLERHSDDRWRGWETSLRAYRTWLRKDPGAKKKIVEQELKQEAVPDALMYYTPIYQLHIALVGLSIVAGPVVSVDNPELINLSATTLAIGLAAVFGYYCWKWRPSVMRSLIERNIVIWRHALGIEEGQHGSLSSR